MHGEQSTGDANKSPAVGCGIGEILARGNGADRQLRVFNANRDIVEVVREIADATEDI
jgi:hypothetical protein